MVGKVMNTILLLVTGFCFSALRLPQDAAFAAALQAGDVRTIEALLGENPVLADMHIYGVMPLHIVVRTVNSEQYEILRLLAMYGADLNVRDVHTGAIPLHDAINAGNKRAVIFLVEQEVDLNVGDNRGLTPLDYAIKSGNKELVEFLESRGACKKTLEAPTVALWLIPCELDPITQEMLGAVRDAKLQLLCALSRGNRGLMLRARDADGYNLLQVAARLGASHIPIMATLLINHGFCINAQHRCTGQTALHRAAQSGDAEAVNFLLLSKADASIRDAAGMTPLDYAVEGIHISAAAVLTGARPNQWMPS